MDILQKIKQINESITLVIQRLEKSGGIMRAIDKELLRQKLVAMYDLLDSEVIVREEVTQKQNEALYGSIKTEENFPESSEEKVAVTEKLNEEKKEIIKDQDKVEVQEQISKGKDEEMLQKATTEEVSQEKAGVPRTETIPDKEISNEEIAEQLTVTEQISSESTRAREEKPDEVIQTVEEIEKEPVSEFKEDLFQAAQEQIRKKTIYEKYSRQEPSLNEKLAIKKEHVPLADSLQKGPIKDIRSAITVNMKLAFIRELYKGDQKEYNQMISFLTKCQNYTEAKLFLQEEKEKHPGWDKKPELFDQLMTLIYRRFRM